MLTADILPNAVRQQTIKMIYYHWLIVFFPSWDWRNVFPKFIELCMKTPCLCPSTYIKSGNQWKSLSLCFATKASPTYSDIRSVQTAKSHF